MPENLDDLKDLTSVGKIFQYLRNDPAIEYAFQLDPAEDLGRVAGLFTCEEGVAEVDSLLQNKKLAFVPSTDEKLSCYVICVEPALIYQLTGKYYV